MQNLQTTDQPLTGALTPPLPEYLGRTLAQATFDHLARTVTVYVAFGERERMGLTAFLHVYEQALTPATTKDRKACFLELASIYPPRAGEEAVQKVRFDAYHDALRHLPADILRAACKQCVKTLKFFPMPSEILGAAAPLLGERLTIVARLRGLRDYHIEIAGKKDELSDEVRAKRRVQAQEWRRMFEAGAEG